VAGKDEVGQVFEKRCMFFVFVSGKTMATYGLQKEMEKARAI
jgi:hypothetical protein